MEENIVKIIVIVGSFSKMFCKASVHFCLIVLIYRNYDKNDIYTVIMCISQCICTKIMCYKVILRVVMS